MPPFEIHVFSPSSTKPSPSRRADIDMLATSEPDAGSVNAKAAMAFPARVFVSHVSRWSLSPKSEMGPAPRPCMAKEKSASPECHASVSRASARVRTSIGFVPSAAGAKPHQLRDDRLRQDWLTPRPRAAPQSSGDAVRKKANADDPPHPSLNLPRSVAPI